MMALLPVFVPFARAWGIGAAMWLLVGFLSGVGRKV